MLYQKFPFGIWDDPNFTYCFRANISQTNWLVLIEACCHQQSTVCGLAMACLSLCWCRIPPDLTQECVLGDDEGRIWYCPLEIVDIPSPGGTKRHFCFLWSPSSGINTASCNLSLELSKTLRHLMTPQGRLSSSWRAGGRGRRGEWGTMGGVLKPRQLVEVDLRHNCDSGHRNDWLQCSLHLSPGPFSLDCCIVSKDKRHIEMSVCTQLGGGLFNTSIASTVFQNHAVSFCKLYQQRLKTLGQMAQLWGMKNNLVPNVMFFNTPFMVGCSADPLGNNVAFCVGSTSPPFSLPCSEK